MDERGAREVVSKEEFDRRVKAAAWDEMDRLPRGSIQPFGGMWHLRRRLPKAPARTDELEAKLRRIEEERDYDRYRPRSSRWWHAIWPFR